MDMAISMMNLKGMVGRLAGSLKGSGSQQTALIMQSLRKVTDREAGKVPLIGYLPVEKQYLITGGVLIASLLLAAGFTIYSSIQVGNKAQYEARSGQLQMQSQRMALAAQQAVLGNREAFKKLASGKSDFETTLSGLIHGDADVPASPSKAQVPLGQISSEWSKARSQTTQILSQEKNLVILNKSVKKINQLSLDLMEVAEQLSNQLSEAGMGVREVTKANLLVTLSQRLPKNANALLTADLIDTGVVLQLEKDVTLFKDTVQSLMEGKAASKEDSMATLEDVGTNMADMVEAVGAVLANSRPLLQSKQAARDLFVGSDKLLKDTSALSSTYHSMGSSGYLTAAVFALLSVASLVFLGLVNINETKSRAKKSEEENTRNQEAILRLMDELGQLAEGNLAMNASVTEDITGAVADSINYTVEELRTLVRGINSASRTPGFRATRTRRDARGQGASARRRGSPDFPRRARPAHQSPARSHSLRRARRCAASARRCRNEQPVHHSPRPGGGRHRRHRTSQTAQSARPESADPDPDDERRGALRRARVAGGCLGLPNETGRQRNGHWRDPGGAGRRASCQPDDGDCLDAQRSRRPRAEFRRPCFPTLKPRAASFRADRRGPADARDCRPARREREDNRNAPRKYQTQARPRKRRGPHHPREAMGARNELSRTRSTVRIFPSLPVVPRD